ncbi:MAG: alanine racemase [Terriglobales bacterium]
MRPTWAEISRSALQHNFRIIQQHVAPATVCAIVKANAYGHGLVACARTFKDAGAEWFGVTGTEEGVQLREAGIRGRILLMTCFWRGEQDDVIEHHLTPAIWEWWQVGALENALVKRNAPPASFPVHIKVDTGMARLGVPDYYVGIFLKRMKAAAQLKIEGIFSHLASAEVLDDAGAERQIAKFEEYESFVREQGYQPEYTHLANSAAIAGRPQIKRTMVRPGLLLYGYALPFAWRGTVGAEPDPLPVHRALTWKSRIISTKDVGEGQAVGYKSTWTTTRKAKLALLPVGYADGLARLISGRGDVLIRGHRARIVGAISMDMTIVDVTDIPGVQLGDEVTLLGRDGEHEIDAREHARHTETIPYEVLCRITGRVPRRMVE